MKESHEGPSQASPLWPYHFVQGSPQPQDFYILGKLKMAVKERGKWLKIAQAVLHKHQCKTWFQFNPLSHVLFLRTVFFFYFHKDSLVFPGERKVSKASIFSRPLHH